MIAVNFICGHETFTKNPGSSVITSLFTVREDVYEEFRIQDYFSFVSTIVECPTTSYSLFMSDGGAGFVPYSATNTVFEIENPNSPATAILKVRKKWSFPAETVFVRASTDSGKFD